MKTIKLKVEKSILNDLNVDCLYAIIDKNISGLFRGFLSSSKDKKDIIGNLPITKFSIITPMKNIFTNVEANFEPYTKTEICYPFIGVCKTGGYLKEEDVLVVLRNNVNLIPKILNK